MKTQTIQKTNTKLGAAMRPIFAGLNGAHLTIQTKTQAYHDDVIYDIIEMGLWFLKAKTEVGHGKFVDFIETVTEQLFKVSRMTVARYMNAATNAGLTAESDPAQIEKMREAKILHGRKPTELYKLPNTKPEPPEPPRDPQLDLFEDLFREFSENTASLIQSRAQVPPEKYEEITNQLHDALCKWSDCDWEPRERGSHTDGSTIED